MAGRGFTRAGSVPQAKQCLLFNLRYAYHLGTGGNLLQHLLPAGLPQCLHALGAGLVLEGPAVGLVQNQLSAHLLWREIDWQA